MSDNDEKEPAATAVSRRLAPGGGGGGAWLGGPKTASSEKYGNTDKKDFHLLGTDLFGNEVKADVSGKLREKFDFPPFTVLNAREGPWQERKRAWLSLGIQSEVGRGENLLKMSDTMLEPDPVKRAAMQAARGLTWGVTDMDMMRNREAALDESHPAAAGWQPTGLTFASGSPRRDPVSLKLQGFSEEQIASGDLSAGPSSGSQTGTSIFDPVLTELCYRWFCPPGGLILDPFAGGSVRGLVAGLLGFRYHGIDLRPEQIAANEAQRNTIAPDADIQWQVGDSNKLLDDAPEADFVFSCPPYGDLEQYSDDPDDLSALTWEQFVGLYRSIIRKAVARLKPNRFACFVVGEYRDKETGLYRGFVPLTCASFMAAGAPLYNEAILITAVGSLPIRVTKQFETSRKLGKTHQNIIIACKGDPKLAAQAISQASGLSSTPGPRPAKRPPKAETPASRPEAGPAEEGGALAFAQAPTIQAVAPTSGGSLADFLGTQARVIDWKADVPPENLPKEIVLNFATTGLDWAKGDRPVGVTVSTLDGQLTRFLPFGFRGEGNLDEAVVKRWFKEQIRDKRITNAHAAFEVHMAREWGCDLEEQGCEVSDIQHYAALLDDHRRKFALDVLIKDFLPEEQQVSRVDETRHSDYEPYEVAKREIFTAQITAKLRNAMWPMLDEQELQQVRQLEDETIYPVVEMEKNGAPLDMELLEQYHAECTARHGELMREIVAEAGFAFDFSAEAWSRLFEKCGLPPSESHAENIIGQIDHPLMKKVHRAGQYASLDSKTFAAYLKQVDSDGVLRYSINQLRGDEGGTVSGRFSIGYVQQVPNKDNHFLAFGDELFPRRLFIAKRGQYLEADAMQIEYRLFAHFASNKEVLEAYRQDPLMSFHKMTWEMIKRMKPDMLYSHQKNLNFAKMYGAKLVKLALMMGFITAQDADEIREGKLWNDPRLNSIREIEGVYRRVMPEVDDLLDRASHLAKAECDKYCKKTDALHRQFKHRGYVKTLLGRRSRFPKNYKTYIGLNRVLQGTASDIMKRKLVELHRERKNTGFLLRMTVHDMVGGDAQEPDTLAKVNELLNMQSFPELRVPILWDCKQGPNWAECK